MTATTADAPPPDLRLPKRRGVELSLLVCAVLISVYGYVEVGLAKGGAVPPDAARYGAGLGVLALLAHLAVRYRAPYADPLFLPIAVLLNGLGLALIYRLDLETPNNAAAPTQLIWSTLGVALFIGVVIFLRDHRILQRYAYLSVVAALVLMLLPILFPAVNGAKIWIRIGGLSFQPGEFAKILLAVFFAAYLAANHNALAYTGRRIWKLQLPTGRVLGPIVAIWLLSVGVLVLERDLGTSLLFFGLFVIMLYVATGRTGWIAVGLLLAAAGAVAVSSWNRMSTAGSRTGSTPSPPSTPVRAPASSPSHSSPSPPAGHSAPEWDSATPSSSASPPSPTSSSPRRAKSSAWPA